MELERIPEHEAILKAEEPTMMVTGRPGRGKTTLAMRLAQSFLDQSAGLSQSVLFLTFSRNAAYQIRQASYKHLHDRHKDLWISTYHSFMWWLLTTFGRYHGLPSSLTVVGATSARALGLRTDWGLEEILRVAQDHGAVPYSGFAPLALRLLRSSPWLRQLLARRFPLVVVDEFQDTSDEQWEFVQLISSQARLVCFADPDQMIYRWQGANELRLAQVLTRPKAAHYPMQSQCLRTANESLLNFAESILDARPGDSRTRKGYRSRFLADYFGGPALGYGLKGVIREFYKDFAGRRRDEYPTIAIASYSNSGALRIAKALGHSTAGAPKKYKCSMLGSDEDDHATDLLSTLIHLNVQPDQVHLKQALQLFGAILAPKPASASGPIASLLDPQEIMIDPGRARGTAKVVMRELQDVMLCQSESLSAALQRSYGAVVALRTAVKGIADAIDDENLEAKQATLAQTISSLPKASPSQGVGLLRDRVSAERVRQTVEETVLPPRGIISSTLHKLKGREFDYVCVVATSGDRFMGAQSTEQDARRLLYVALTRARLDARVLYVPTAPPPLLEPYLQSG